MTRNCLIAASLILLIGCESAERKKEEPLDKALERERQAEKEEPEAYRAQARKAVSDYARASLPKWNVQGLSLAWYYGVYVAAVDVSAENDRQTMHFIVRPFIPESGETYWKVDPLDPSLVKAYGLNMPQPMQEKGGQR